MSEQQPHPDLQGTPWGNASYDPSCPDCRDGVHGSLMAEAKDVDESFIVSLRERAAALSATTQPETLDVERRDWTVHPGEMLGEALAERSMSQTEFARRMGLTPKHVNRIIKGHAGFSPTVAVGMELVLGIGATLWLRVQADYELHRARLAAALPTPDAETRS